MLIDLSGKVALVTGSSRGIGRVCALELARSGADVVVSYHSQAAMADAVVAEIAADGHRAVARQADVGRREDCAALVECAVEQFGRLDIVVLNAYRDIRKPVLETTPEDVATTWNSTLWHGFHLSQLAAQQMVAQGQGGRLIFISSVHAHSPYSPALAYNTAKAGLNHMAKSLAVELAEHQILCNSVEPGWIDTEGERVYYTEEELRERGRELPLGRLGTGQDIANLVTFLASEQAAYITGAVLRVDGGYVLPRLR